ADRIPHREAAVRARINGKAGGEGARAFPSPAFLGRIIFGPEVPPGPFRTDGGGGARMAAAVTDRRSGPQVGPRARERPPENLEDERLSKAVVADQEVEARTEGDVEQRRGTYAGGEDP